MNDRPYGKHFFRAAKLMREGILLNKILTNAESWMNVTKNDIEDLRNPNIYLLRKVVLKSVNPSKCVIHLELGIILVKVVIIQKRMIFFVLHMEIKH